MSQPEGNAILEAARMDVIPKFFNLDGVIVDRIARRPPRERRPAPGVSAKQLAMLAAWQARRERREQEEPKEDPNENEPRHEAPAKGRRGHVKKEVLKLHGPTINMPKRKSAPKPKAKGAPKPIMTAAQLAARAKKPKHERQSIRPNVFAASPPLPRRLGS
ncbi:hypothetical protein AK812_SmicGene19545 [Symbiodinium microadriaticum]|uniref:Uncharacterized protein n=1 Tax=Symbiodinium microadriaticum TaxID=2951 RepID=A0A1Q9DSA3_SYMMI|nr:hypothetical protein AK812_SmicGene19545 [Symbiodinium microadriaticum]